MHARVYMLTRLVFLVPSALHARAHAALIHHQGQEVGEGVFYVEKIPFGNMLYAVFAAYSVQIRIHWGE